MVAAVSGGEVRQRSQRAESAGAGAIITSRALCGGFNPHLSGVFYIHIQKALYL